MKYLLTFVRDQDQMYSDTEEEMQAAMEAWTAFDQAAVEAGAMIACEPLELPKTATTIRIVGDGDHEITDGPFAETKEQLGGFALLECADRNEAMDWALKVPMRPGSAIELRAGMDLSPFGYESSTVRPVNARAAA